MEDFLEANTARIRTSLSLITKVILVIAIGYALYFNHWRILFIDILLLIIVLIPVILKKQDINIPHEIEIILFVFVILSFFLGEISGLIIQIFFGMAVGFVGFTLMLILFKNSKIKLNYFLIFAFALSFSLALGTLSELAKYYLKLYFKYNQTIGDYTYAITSLTLVLLGALAACLIGYVYTKYHKIPILKNLVYKFKTKNPNLFIERTDSPDEILESIKKGENEKLEFKSTLRTNIHTCEFDRNVELSALKTISAFLNSEGGTLLIGVSDQGFITGIEKDNFMNNDKFNLHFTNLIKEHIGNEFLPYLHSELVLIEGKNILKVDCMKSEKPVFLKYNKSEEFYIRVGAASVQIIGSKLVNYIKNSFKG